jgi:N-acyl-phosphatidylethanolamine-hydrolysing phospholipase D
MFGRKKSVPATSDRAKSTKVRGLAWLVGLVLAAASIGAATVSSGCATTNNHYNVNKKHHTPNGFNNNYGPAGGKPLSELLQWKREASKKGDPKPPSQVYKGYEGFPVVKPDLAFLKNNRSEISVTWISHATTLIQVNGLNILTDPVFSDRVSPVSFAGPDRKVPLPVQLAELPRIDIVLISHNHYDHLDRPTVLQLKAQAGGEPLFLVPLGIDDWLKNEGLTKVKAFDWWDQQAVLGLNVHFVPAQHWSSRSPFDRNATLWGGWVLEHQGFKTYFVGDSGMSKDFLDIGAKFGGFDVSLIPVGAYEPRWFMKDQHVNPAEAVQIHQDVKSKYSIGIHWGSFELTDEALDQPMVDLPIALKQAQIPAEQFELFKHGQTRIFKR